MKILVIILSLIFSVNICLAEQKGCSTGYACSLDKLIEQENLMGRQKLIEDIKKSNEQKMFKENKFENDKIIKDYDDFFVFTKSKKEF